MAELLNVTRNEVITTYVNLTDERELTVTVHRAVDGSEYISRYGEPTIHYVLTLYLNEDGKTRLESAQESVDLLQITVKRGVFSGRIIEVDEYEKLIDGWYEVKVTLSSNCEVVT